MTITLEQIKAEAERIYGDELVVRLVPYTAAQYVAGDIETKHGHGLIVFDAGDRILDLTYTLNDLDQPLEAFVKRHLEPSVSALKNADLGFIPGPGLTAKPLK